MTALPGSVDVAIVGAGTAGAAAAALCADRGLSTLCVDRRALADAGARWCNGVPRSAFDTAAIPPPEGPELRAGGGRFHLIAGYGPRRVVIDDHGVLEVDMRHLVARLQGLAREAGAVLAGDVAVRGVEANGVGSTLRTERGAVSARWIVDASGLAGARLLEQPTVERADICAAAQQVHALRDAGAARAFFDEHGVAMGEVACFTGVAGGYSILNVRAEHDHVAILTGSVPADGHPGGKAILDDFVAAQPWIGERLFGGSRAIPLRRPYDRLTDGRVAALGDAGCQVFPAHGSGIGAGMIAARVLADALAGGDGLHGYAVAWQREHGALLAAYDLFRRFSQRMTLAELEQLIELGLMDEDTSRFGLAQRFPALPPPASLLAKLAALVRAPRLGARLAAVGVRMAAARALYARYPSRPEALPAWSRRIARVFGDRPDLGRG